MSWSFDFSFLHWSNSSVILLMMLSSNMHNTMTGQILTLFSVCVCVCVCVWLAGKRVYQLYMMGSPGIFGSIGMFVNRESLLCTMRYQHGIRKPKIPKGYSGQTKQWPKDTKGQTLIHKTLHSKHFTWFN